MTEDAAESILGGVRGAQHLGTLGIFTIPSDTFAMSLAATGGPPHHQSWVSNALSARHSLVSLSHSLIFAFLTLDLSFRQGEENFSSADFF